MDLKGPDASMFPSALAPPPECFAGRYRLSKVIGAGGMATVWRADDLVLSRVVAVKLLHPEHAIDGVARQRFWAEARAAASISHPNVVSIFDFGEDQVDGGDNGEVVPFLVMEFVDGRSLAEDLAARGPLPAREVAAAVEQAARGLSSAHALGLVHRDIKPENLLVTPDATVKITDFGIARAADSLPLTRTGAVVGTALYISPEQATGRAAGPASDLYSLGVVGYTCLSGAPPFDAGNPLATALAHVRDPVPPLPASVPAALQELVIDLLAKDPAHRPASGLEVAGRARAAGEQSPGDLSAAWGSAPVPPAGPPAPEYVDPAPRTAVLPAGWEPTSPPDRPRAGARGKKPGLRQRRAGAVLALAAAAMAGIVIATAGTDSRTVPNVLGDTVAVARAAIEHAGLAPAVRLTDAPGPAGYVLAESPRAGAELGRGRVVQVTVSSGSVQVDGSTYAGKPYAVVAAELAASALRPLESYVTSDSTPGVVLSVSPQGSVPVGSTVDVQVAAPPAVPPVAGGGSGGL
ncbi:MAG TPA: protein kinase, partial [Acidimicrobiales bacterium]|nr:protein kinase [Acidimicrobiales bacterium]